MAPISLRTVGTCVVGAVGSLLGAASRVPNVWVENREPVTALGSVVSWSFGVVGSTW